jgi:anaerobic magnesium-protoporphyrin IX monomethyl ester cyclase
MRITFLYPPLDDPTMPYHAGAYLRGHLKKNGFRDVSVRDLNIEFVCYCLEEATVRRFYNDADRRLTGYGKKSELTALEQLEYIALWGHQFIEPETLQQAAHRLRSKDLFLDYPQYVNSVRLLNRYFAFLGCLSFPAAIVNSRQVSRMNYSIYSLDDLFDPAIAEKVCYPFLTYFHDRLTRDPELLKSDCLGITVTYDYQMMYATWLARALKAQWPDKLVVMGGTAISQFYKYMKDKSQMGRFAGGCDAVVVGEGETAICEIAAREGDLGDVAIPNTITFDKHTGIANLPERIHYENVSSLGSPVYNCQWDLYLSPARGINYAPTRGCYWNRCTFCDYGLNTDGPTSPWRERKVEQVVEDLEKAACQNQIEYVYFAVDVMSPSYLERLSDAMSEAQLGLRWSAELRMEKAFSPDRCRKMAKAGCVCASFGMESGDQRILDLIDKGTRISYMAETMKNFAGAGIAVQIMAFTDFPTESAAEKKATFDFLQNNREYWSAGGIGTFSLTGGAILAKNPERFGLKLLEVHNVDIARSIHYRAGDRDRETLLLTEEFDESFDNRGDIFPQVLGRPWAGGTDTLHSMIYYSCYERTIFKDHDLKAESPASFAKATLLDCVLRLNAPLKHSIFDISRILANRRSHRRYAKQLLREQIEPTYVHFREWLATIPALPRLSHRPPFWIANHSKGMKLDDDILPVLLLASEKPILVREVLHGRSSSVQEKILIYLEMLSPAGLISLTPSGQDGQSCHLSPPIPHPSARTEGPAHT